MSRSRSDQDDDPIIRKIAPRLPRSVMINLTAFIETKILEQDQNIAKSLRQLSSYWKSEDWALQLRGTALVIADLIDQGWTVQPDGHRVLLSPPGLRTSAETVPEAKARVRKSLQIGREHQLANPSVHKFIARMSRPAQNNGVVSSALDLIDDGADLANVLRDLDIDSTISADNQLKSIIDPVIELCDDVSRCPETGIRLMDIWRFFRHTWSLEYRSIPGRQVPILIRNRARPRRPVIGIALLASPVLRTKPRDNWIGWTPEPFLAKLKSGVWDPKIAIHALSNRIDESISEIRYDDLASSDEVSYPTERVVLRLEQKGAVAALARGRELQSDYSEQIEERGAVKSQNDPTRNINNNINWLEASNDLLFVRKRAETLSRLLSAKIFFQTLDWDGPIDKLFYAISSTKDGFKSLGTALQEFRKAGLSSQVADLSVCGAIAPYNTLLGGKLVALLMASDEVRSIWKTRYTGKISIISSQMAGRPICRSPDLKIITTTSLYGSGSSQYNRLKLKVSDFKDIVRDINWKELDKTAGYGTVHLGSETVQVLRRISEVAYKARRINNRFGEGTSPRLRQVREGLDALGITSDDVLHHATPRIFYACELEEKSREQLLGLEISDKAHLSPSSDDIAEAWRQRWLSQRIRNPDVIEAMSKLNGNTVKNELLTHDLNGQYVMPLE